MPTLGIRSHTDACTLVVARAVDGTDFRQSGTGDGGCAGWRAQSARVWGSVGATARAVCRPWVSGHTDACTHVGAESRRDRFLSIEQTVVGVCPGRRKVCLREHRRAMARRRRQLANNYVPVAPTWARQMFEYQKRSCDGAGGGAQSARVLESDGAMAQAVCRPCVTGHTDTCSHLAGAVDMTDFATENRCWDCAAVAAHSHRGGWRPMARWRSQFAHDGFQSHRCMHDMLAWEVDVPDSRLSRNGDGAVPAVAHGLRECRAAIVRRRKQFAYLGYPFTTLLAHTSARVVDVADFRLSRNGDGALPAATHSWRACRIAMARRPGRFSDLGLSGHYDACTHVGAGGRRGRFPTVEKR